MPSPTEMKHLTKMVNIIRSNGGIEKDRLVLESGISIAWAEKLCKYIPMIFTDVKFDKKHRQFLTQKTLSELEKEVGK